MEFQINFSPPRTFADTFSPQTSAYSNLSRVFKIPTKGQALGVNLTQGQQQTKTFECPEVTKVTASHAISLVADNHLT